MEALLAALEADPRPRRSDVLRAKGAHDAAMRRYAQALALYEKAGEASRGELARALTGLGVVHTALGEYDAAQRALERALEPELAETRFALARALWPDRAHRRRARDLATLARDGYRETGDRRGAQLAEVEAWLATR